MENRILRSGIGIAILTMLSGCYAPEEPDVIDIIDPPPRYYIVPLGEVEEDDLLFAEAVLEAAFDTDYEILEPEDFPESTYITERGQYDGREFLDTCERGGEDMTVYLTSKNITRPENNFIYGIAYRPGTIALVSNYVMKGVKSRLAKTLIHEVGHNYGLHHCENSDCPISTPDGNYFIDCQDIFFCEECAAELGLSALEREERIKALEEVLSK